MRKYKVNVEFDKCSFDASKDFILEEEDDDLIEIPSAERIQIGSIYFDEHRIDSKHIPFMLTSYDTDMKDVTDILLYDWKVPDPRIILFAVAEFEGSPSEQYRELSRKLVKGIVHAVNTTEMWLCTDGLNRGFGRDIGKAFEKEIFRRKTKGALHSVFPDTSLIGICKREDLTFSDQLGQEELKEEDKNKETKTDINKRYNYFILLESSTKTVKKISHFLLDFSNYLSKYEEYSKDIQIPKTEMFGIPVITLLMHGKITQIDLILGRLKLGLPIVVLEGSGGLADVIAHVFHQANYRPEGINEAEYLESVLKRQVLDILHSKYSNFSTYEILSLTEKIFDCIRYSRHREQTFISILDLTDVEFSPSLFTSHLLNAIFKAETSDVVKDIQTMKKQLFLAMDWNCADVAKQKVFSSDMGSKFQIDGETFFRALTKPHREEFFSLFLNQGFIVHLYLDSASLLELFQNSLNREFFKTVVWENAIGFGDTSELSRSFLDSTLIILIEEMTGIPSLINSYELDWNSRAIYDDRTPEEAERKAMMVLVMWAILSYRVQLVKTLWRHSEQPIHVALTCSIILKKLEAYVSDLSLKNEMEMYAKEFSVMAVDVMTLCYESVPCRALDQLKEKNRVWSCKALQELAAFSKNKMFLAHPCCQKYLDNLLMGHVRIVELQYGDMTMPLWLKIILSAFLIFPMFFWVRFETSEKEGQSVESPKSSSSSDSKSSLKNEPETPESNTKKSRNIPFYRKLYYFWSAPITKFWVSQVFYVLFLILFSLAVIWPACGNVFLDFFTCIWIAALIVDLIYHTYTLNMQYTSMPLVLKCLEISVMIIFLFGYVMGRIIWKQTFMTPYSAKVMLCLALLYFYYRLIFIALPVSSDLGPMLYRVKRMVAVDFVGFIRVAILIILSNGIAIHAIVYPDYPLNLELVRRAFYDAFISFFLTPAGPWGEADPKCIRLNRHPNKMSFIGLSQNVCKVGRYMKVDCPNPGVWPYLFGLQYLLILRMILLVMLFALFSNTTKILEEEGMYIWKYQRYELIINFSHRLTLPPPLSCVTILYKLLRHLFYCLCDYANVYILKYSKIKGFKKKYKPHKRDKLTEDDFRYWKSLAQRYFTNKIQEEAKAMTTRKRIQRMRYLTNDLNNQRKELRDLEGHLNELQLQILNAHQYLELDGLQVSVRERLQVKNVPQIFSRMSPYPNTKIYRFPVSDNHVPWKVEWTLYDPVSFTLPTDNFPPHLRPHVDVDIQKKREKEGEAFRMPEFIWNKITVSPGGVAFDRLSWMTDSSNRTIEYELDSEHLPKNPVGRTGLKGRGCLPRWGPNHFIYVIITRWHRSGKIFHKCLEVLLMPKRSKLSLPGGYVYTGNRYEIIESLFHTEERWGSSEDMVRFFKSFAPDISVSKRPSLLQKIIGDETKYKNNFTAERIKLGYMDDDANTDQAWCEAEVWHFHYNVRGDIEEKLKGALRWHLLSEENLTRVPIGQAALMHTVANNMKAVFEIS